MNLQSGFSVPINDLNFFTKKMPKNTKKEQALAALLQAHASHIHS
jgi:hypothetical protein